MLGRPRRRRGLAGGHGRLHPDPRPRPLRGPAHLRSTAGYSRPSAIFLNVGGRAVVPDIPGLADVDYLTNVGILELDTVPEHLVIVGGSYIALEFAQMYRRFGADVTVVEKGPRLTSREDEDVSAAIQEILENEGIDVIVGADRDVGHQAGQRFWGGVALTPRDGAEPDRRQPSAGGHGPAAQHRRPGSGRGGRRDRRARLHRRRRSVEHQRRAHLGDGGLQRQAARSPTRPTTTSRSSRPTCSTTIRAGSATASPPTRSTSTRRWAGPG